MATPVFTAPTTWVPITGAVPTAGDLNNQLRDNVLHVAAPSMCQATRSATLSITSAAWTNLTLPGAEDWDTDAIHSTGSNTERFTIPTGLGGIWEISCFAVFAASAAGSVRLAKVMKNGSVILSDPGGYIGYVGTPLAGQPAIMIGTRYVQCAAADWLSIQVFQDSGGALNITNATVSVRKVSN